MIQYWTFSLFSCFHQLNRRIIENNTIKRVKVLPPLTDCSSIKLISYWNFIKQSHYFWIFPLQINKMSWHLNKLRLTFSSCFFIVLNVLFICLLYNKYDYSFKNVLTFRSPCKDWYKTIKNHSIRRIFRKKNIWVLGVIPRGLPPDKKF